jgi:hypothetical protein
VARPGGGPHPAHQWLTCLGGLPFPVTCHGSAGPPRGVTGVAVPWAFGRGVGVPCAFATGADPWRRCRGCCCSVSPVTGVAGACRPHLPARLVTKLSLIFKRHAERHAWLEKRHAEAEKRHTGVMAVSQLPETRGRRLIAALERLPARWQMAHFQQLVARGPLPAAGDQAFTSQGRSERLNISQGRSKRSFTGRERSKRSFTSRGRSNR